LVSGGEDTETLLLEELGRKAELTRRVRALERDATRELPPTIGPSQILTMPLLDALRARHSARVDDPELFERDRSSIERSLLERAPGLSRQLWLRTRAALVETEADAQAALAALPSNGLPPYQGGGIYHLSVGKVLLLSGRTNEAADWFVRAVGSCRTLSAPVTWVRAHYWLGRVRQAQGNTQAACQAYATVLEHWGHATLATATVTATRRASDALHCPKPD
jgi:hypothetical protein